jgi:hypothetical protein
MKHLLSILILLGFMSVANAGWFITSDEEYIENCTDKDFLTGLNSNIEKWNKEIQDIEEGQKSPGYLVFGDEKWDKYALKKNREKIDRIKKYLSNFKKMTLKEKLSNDEITIEGKYYYPDYESIFKDCVDEFEEDEITFKAKWK